MSQFTRWNPVATRYQQTKLDWIETNLMNNDTGYGEHCFGSNAQPEKDFRGRGMIHLTHYETYRRCASAIGQPIDSQPELVESNNRVIIETALWFWKDNKIGAIANNHANDGDAGVTNVTRPINSGLAGLTDRQKYKREISAIFDQMFLANHAGCRG
jgi:predicted chitinase